MSLTSQERETQIMAASVTTTSNLHADESGQPVPVQPDAPKGKTVDQDAVKPVRRASVPSRVKRLAGIASHILTNRGKEAKIQLQIAADLLLAEPMFVGEDGKPGTLPIPATGIDGQPIVSDLSFYDWCETVCRLNYSSVRQYLQAARFAKAHPAAAVQAESIKSLAVLEAASVRKPEAVKLILADLPAEGATIAAVETAIAKHAPKTVKKPKTQDTSKIQTALELAARDQYWTLLSQTCNGMEAAQIVAVQDLCTAVATMATDPNVGKGSAVFASALGQLSREWNEQREAAAEKRAAAAEKRTAKRTR